MKRAKSKPSPSSSYEAEKHLRQFCVTASEQLYSLLSLTTGEIEYALTRVENANDGSLLFAREATLRAANTVRNLRYFAQHTRLEIRIVDLAQLVLDTVEKIEGEFKRRGVELNVLVESTVYCELDASAVHQALLNFFWFSAHTMPRGGKLTASLHTSGKRLQISISDNGHGLSEDQLEHLFEPQLAEKAPNEDAMALGLCVSQAVFEAQGGEVQVISRLGHGTNFIVSLPYNNKLPAPEPFSEKRRFRRVPVQLPVEVSVGADKVLGLATTLSVGGAFVSLPARRMGMEVGKTFQFRIYYEEQTFIDVGLVRIATVLKQGGMLGLGIEFLEVEEKAKRLLAALVKNHVG